MDSTNVLTFLGALQDVRELLSGLARYCDYDGLMALESAIGFSQPGTAQKIEITSDMLLIAMLCSSQDIGNATFHHFDPVTEIGRLALQRIGAALLRDATDLDERQLTHALAASNVQNVLNARRLCLTGIKASLSPDNCFRLFRFADECGISPLRQAAEQVCLASMPAGIASAKDNAGFLLLHQDQLKNLLQSDALQVSSELDVFRAIAAWVNAAPHARAQLMTPLVQRCVRVSTMDLVQLELLDQEPVVLGNQEVTRIVARAYVMKLMGVAAADGDLAAGRPRHSVAALAAAAKAKAESAAAIGAAGESWMGALSRPFDGMVWAH